MDDINPPNEENTQKIRKKTRIEKVEQKLYAKNPDLAERERRDFSQKNYNYEQNWKDNIETSGADLSTSAEVAGEKENYNLKPRRRRMGIFGWILILAAIFFVGSIGYASYIFFGGGTDVSGDDVNINILGPVSIGGGERLSLDVLIQNNNAVPLENVDLIVDYPDGTKDALNLVTDLNIVRTGLGQVAAGSTFRQTIDAALFGQEGDNKEISVGIEYSIPGSNAIFDKQKDFNIALTAAPVRLVTDGLKEISSGQTFELDFKVSSNSNETLNDVMIVIDYPFGFDFESSDLKPSIGNNIWTFDQLEPTDEFEIKITGQLSGQNEEERVFRLNAGLVNEDNNEELGIVFTNALHVVMISRPFIDLNLTLDQSDNSVIFANSGDVVNGVIKFNNNTNDIVRDVVIKLTFESDVLDDSSVEAFSGFYQSANKTLTFDKETFADLSEIEPRSLEIVDFNFETIDLSVNNFGVRNPEVKIAATVSGQRITSGDGEEFLESADKTVKILSDVISNSFTLYDQGPIVNSGPIPPISEQETTYTVLWSVSNATNDLSGAKIITTLPSYIEWTDSVSPSTEDITYDPLSRKITWLIGDIPAGIGFVDQAKTVNFQLKFLPSKTQVGTTPNLIKNTTFIATDDFAGTTIEKLMNNANITLEGRSGIDRHDVVIGADPEE